MVIDTFYENGTKIIFSYFPAWEMFFSMHVLANPEHHGTRKKWVDEKEKQFPELVKKIRELKELADDWNLIIDSPLWSQFRQMEIPEMLSALEKKNIYQWNEIVNYTGNVMSIPERDRILKVIKEYYQSVYKREELFLRPGLARVLKREAVRCMEQGLEKWAKNIHSRLIVEKDTITFVKNKEYRFDREEVDAIYITVSTFVDPHLWMCQTPGEIEIVKRLPMEEIECDIPEDFTLIFKALGDSNRLKIIQCLLQGMGTTQEIAKHLSISEAAVSKHLKLLKEAGLVKKQKHGYYVEYEFLIEKINYLPYLFYETMRI